MYTRHSEYASPLRLYWSLPCALPSGVVKNINLLKKYRFWISILMDGETTNYKHCERLWYQKVFGYAHSCIFKHVVEQMTLLFAVEYHKVRIFTLCQHSCQHLICCRYLTHRRSMCAGTQYVLYVPAHAHTCTVHKSFPACAYVSPAVYLSLTVHWAGIQQLLPGGPEPAWWPPPLSKPELAHWWLLLSKKQKVCLDRNKPVVEVVLSKLNFILPSWSLYFTLCLAYSQ